MASRYKFSEEEIKAIERARRDNKDKRAEARLKALELRAKGAKASEVAEATGFHIIKRESVAVQSAAYQIIGSTIVFFLCLQNGSFINSVLSNIDAGGIVSDNRYIDAEIYLY